MLLKVPSTIARPNHNTEVHLLSQFFALFPMYVSSVTETGKSQLLFTSMQSYTAQYYIT